MDEAERRDRLGELAPDKLAGSRPKTRRTTTSS